MGIFDGCVLACDIDGTLMSADYLSPRNVEKIEYFTSQGGFFSICTGRSVGAISEVTEKIKQISLSIVFNGCMIYDYENNKVCYEVCIPESDKHIVKKILDSGYDFGIEIHSDFNVYTLKQTSQTDDHQRYERLKTVLIDYETVKKLKWNKVLFALNSQEDYNIISKLLEGEKYVSDFVKSCAIIYDEKRNYYEQLPSGISKASAIDVLSKQLNIKKNGLFAIGDYYNDAGMLKKADISAVPAGAPDELKSIVDFVAGSCEEGAVADFIDYLTDICKNRKV